MIVNLEKFIRQEREGWDRLDAMLRRMADDPFRKLPLEEARTLDALYRRAAADLARLADYSAEAEARGYLEHLVARAHAEIHGVRSDGPRFRPREWLFRVLPRTIRGHSGALGLACALTVGGVLFGGAAIAFDPEAKEALMPYAYLQGSPTERVAREEKELGKRYVDHKGQFSGFLMTHNTQVALTAMSLGLTWGIGTAVLMLSNGIMLGAVAMDYVLAGQAPFLLGWLLPHGVIEIPAILIAGQAGFVLADAVIGRGQRKRLAARVRASVGDVATLCFGAALLLVWAGIVEAFFSQYHEPVIPYGVKIGFGLLEAAGLATYLLLAGRGVSRGAAP
jgi:uncharacterized membrane protein SpoIIM required for sporulation